jgi:hypothetical protein
MEKIDSERFNLFSLTGAIGRRGIGVAGRGWPAAGFPSPAGRNWSAVCRNHFRDEVKG